MDLTRTTRGAIEQIVREETRYLRHYFGTVLRNDDELNRGRVLASVPELGWNTEDQAAWCFPRQAHALSVPAIEEIVEIYFMAGDPNRPVYLGLPADFVDNLPPSYVDPTTHIVFEDPQEATLIRWDGATLDLGKTGYLEAARQTDSVEVTIPTNTVVIAVSGGSGSPAVGTLNPSPITLTGEITSGSDQVRIGDE